MGRHGPVAGIGGLIDPQVVQEPKGTQPLLDPARGERLRQDVVAHLDVFFYLAKGEELIVRGVQLAADNQPPRRIDQRRLLEPLGRADDQEIAVLLTREPGPF
jgi:hypothetical protein